jgi:hypothetical protein
LRGIVGESQRLIGLIAGWERYVLQIAMAVGDLETFTVSSRMEEGIVPRREKGHGSTYMLARVTEPISTEYAFYTETLQLT